MITQHFKYLYSICNHGCRERVTRQQYYQQLRENLLNYSQLCSEEKCFLLAAYALQADQGNFHHTRHQGHYFDPREYFPAWVSVAVKWPVPSYII